jgi:uncharacterized DUF497 family protein
MAFEWDPVKAAANFKKHGIRFADSLPAFEDSYAVTTVDDESDPLEQRFVTIGLGAKNQVLTVVFCYRGVDIRIISVRLADSREQKQYEENR